MTKTELDRMLKDAEKATQGEWAASLGEYEQALDILGPNIKSGNRSWLAVIATVRRRSRDGLDWKANRDHIANCSPARIKWMCERIREGEIAVHALLTMKNTGPQPKKLDAALSWRECDEKAEALGYAFLETPNA